ncbi:conserved hypothetical protein [Halobacteriovorax marinus SJ]|uniref:FAD/NAD(P)-binding domain-containing protein n=1 Tax=Halobacteriovorax marinus (strain ATCC BAA-682 / DSM 15412 / SJ) TaxID=862908 RepID=E1WYI2_HALMS|nr:NAD(P)/FAD-dependent oxidoreductase [Halobacteriovorax marinus]CBW26030.1 conserved hypothetical protein [Halobacteriovorax marinus SJ]
MKEVEVLIIGGSHAGLSAAMSLGRLRRTALIVDSGNPRNKVSKHANNIAGLDGINPNELRSRSLRDLEKYNTIEFLKGSVSNLLKEGSKFIATLSDSTCIRARKVILSFGVKDKMPNISGLSEQWGKNVFHCPYCHGHEFQDREIGFIGNGQFAEHIVPMLFSLSPHITIFTMGPAEFSKDFKEKLEEKNISVIEWPIDSLGIEGEFLKSIILNNGEEFELDALFSGPILPLELKSTLADSLGCEKDEMGFIKVDKMGKTNVDGVFAAGDIVTMQHSVVRATSTGQIAGSGVVAELVRENF